MLTRLTQWVTEPLNAQIFGPIESQAQTKKKWGLACFSYHTEFLHLFKEFVENALRQNTLLLQFPFLWRPSSAELHHLKCTRPYAVLWKKGHHLKNQLHDVAAEEGSLGRAKRCSCCTPFVFCRWSDGDCCSFMRFCVALIAGIVIFGIGVFFGASQKVQRHFFQSFTTKFESSKAGVSCSPPAVDCRVFMMNPFQQAQAWQFPLHFLVSDTAHPHHV